MKLKELKNIETDLLYLEQRKFEMSFTDYVIMESYLDNIGEITDHYIQYLTDYNEYIAHYSIEEQENKLKAKNEELLSSEIDIDVSDAKKILEKYQEKHST